MAGMTAVPMSVTREVLYARETVDLLPGKLIPFVAKVHRVRTRRGKDYSVLRMTIPKSVRESVGIEHNEFLFLLAQKAEWYHMIDWDKAPEAWARLPQQTRAILQYCGLVPTAAVGGAPSLTSPQPALALEGRGEAVTPTGSLLTTPPG